MTINLIRPHRQFPLFSGNLILILLPNNAIVTVHCANGIGMMTRYRKVTEWLKSAVN
jgi:hypothetical protein